MNKITRYTIYAWSDGDDDYSYWEAEPHKKGEFVYIEDIVDFIRQFKKGHDIRTELLCALGEVDES
jgi:hypothetical protein